MALTNEEIKLAEALKKSGKNNTEVMRIIAKQRRGENLQPEPTGQRTVGQDVAIGFAKGAGSTLKSASDFGQFVARTATRPFIGDAANQTPGEQAINQGIDRTLEAQNTPQMVGKGLELAAEFASPFVMTRFASLMARAPKISEVAKLPAIADTSIANKASSAIDTAKEFIKNPRLAFGKQNVSPQLESSAQRLFLDGTERLKDPLTTYDNYVTQAKQAITDIKVDPPIAVVGESIGDAFKSVVAKRRNVGNIMSEELKKVADIPTNVLPTIDTFVSDIAKEGLKYDRVTKSVVQTANQVKMTGEDIALIEKYASELQRLGSKPTVGQLDAFMSRIPNEIDVYKASKNITGSTNAERIIKKSLADLREQFSPAINPSFAPYYEARKEYAKLSNFIEEGSGFLGKMTQSGDFAKDASLAKSSVQSILNNGKKDWLMELEKLTGYQALDDSVIALQAMKDAGDFRGLSLLESLSSSVPTSQAGFTQKAIDFAMDKAGRAVAGTPEEQTRAFLKALKESSAQQGAQSVFGVAAGVNPQTGEFSAQDAALGIGAAALGMKFTKAMEPKTIAGTLNAGDFKAFKEVALASDQGSTGQFSIGTFMKVADFLRKRDIDVEKMTLPELRAYIKAIVEEFENAL